MATRSGPFKTLRAAATFAVIDTWYECTNTIQMGPSANCLRLYTTVGTASAGNIEYYIQHSPDGGTTYFDYSGAGDTIEIWGTHVFSAAGTKSIELVGVNLPPNEVVKVFFRASAGAASATVAIQALAFDSTSAASDVGDVSVSLATMDDWDGTEGSAAGTDGGRIMVEAKSSQKTAVDDGDDVIPVANLNGELVPAGFTWATTSQRKEEIDPVSAHHAESTLLALTNIATNTTGYGYLDLDGYRYVALQGETSGTTPTDVLTVTLEASIQDDGTAQASCTYQDVTLELAGVASWVDTDFMVFIDVPLAIKYLRVKYVTSNDSGADADLTVYAKRMF